MRRIVFSIVFMALIMSLMLGCGKENIGERFLVDDIPGSKPLDFKNELVPKDKIIHRGIFSPDMEEYYFTISDRRYEQFDVFMIKKRNTRWSAAHEAFFNSGYSEHGMSFSPDGKTLYFSSTRPVPVDGVPETWHIWKSVRMNGAWSEPSFVDIPNLRDKLVSHPSAAKSGTVYFHAGNPDYSRMDIYRSAQVHGRYENAEKVEIITDVKTDRCTPYVAADEGYLLFAAVGKQFDLMICFNDGSGRWTKTKRLDAAINSDGQGNPYVTPDNDYLFFAAGKHPGNWSIKRVAFKPDALKD